MSANSQGAHRVPELENLIPVFLIVQIIVIFLKTKAKPNDGFIFPTKRCIYVVLAAMLRSSLAACLPACRPWHPTPTIACKLAFIWLESLFFVQRAIKQGRLLLGFFTGDEPLTTSLSSARMIDEPRNVG